MTCCKGSVGLRAVTMMVFAIAASDSGAIAGAARALHETKTVKVAGTGFDDLKNAIVHWKNPTPSGVIQQSTEIVELDGDLKGRVLYQVTSVFDVVKGTLVNTGHQVYSGTIAGSAPAMIHDDQFRFEVNLATGEEAGKVYLLDHIAGPKVRCTLDVIGTGPNGDGNPTFEYHGECRFRGE
jgi:hypothetical protein